MNLFRKYLFLPLAAALSFLSFGACAEVIRSYAVEAFVERDGYGAKLAKFDAALARWRADLSSACASMIGGMTKHGHGFKMSSMLKPGTEAMAC